MLLLNSYNQDLIWTDTITEGVREILESQPISFKLSVESMDTKNFYSPDYLELLVEKYSLKYGDTTFDAIITSDDNAANFALTYRDKLFNNAPIVFCGVNDLEFSQKVEFSNITGVLEFTDFAGTIEAALSMQPGLEEIFIITDETTTGNISRTLLKELLPGFKGRVAFSWLDNVTMLELKNAVTDLPENSAILLVSFNRDKDGNWFTYTESINHLRSVSTVPIYGMWDFYLGKGSIGGMITSGHRQGMLAAEMAVDIINGVNPSNLPVIIQRSNQYMFDQNELSRFGIDTSNLPDDSIVINAPESIYQRFAFEIWLIGCVFVFMTIVIFVLMANNNAKKRAEIELEELNRYQESLIELRTEELVQRSRELEIANHDLKKLDSLKTAVLNTVSHDLRTPLTSVLGFCKIIDRDFKRHFKPLCEGDENLSVRGDRIQANLDIIEKEGERLTRLVNDFLDLSKIESGDISWNDISLDPKQLLEQSRPVLEGYFSETGVSLTLEVEDRLPQILADPDRLLQVLNNLVGNAAKFTYKGNVKLVATTTEGGWLKVIVQDTGIGIPQEELDNIFNKFYQVSLTTSDTRKVTRGSGMGLAISKRIIEHYGGELKAESEPNHGSSFTFTIPEAG